MEAINNVVQTASKAIWGEQDPAATTSQNETGGKEPVAGLQGRGTAQEPFDQGNSVPSIAGPGSAAAPSTSTLSTLHSDKSITSDTPPSYKPMSFIPVGSETSTNPPTATIGREPKPLERETETTGVATANSHKHSPKVGDIVPSESSEPGVSPALGTAPSQKQQGADRPGETPEDNPSAFLAKRDPNDHSGEPMHMHDGSEMPSTQEERRTSKAGLPGGQEHGREPKGTGEQWVRTSGLHVDGGNFDATNPGAGREADRLLEDKGVRRDGSGAMDNSAAATAGNETNHKASKLDKLKDKLHIGPNKDR